MPTSLAPNINQNSYMKLSAILCSLDGRTLFGTGCSGCWSLRRQIAPFKSSQRGEKGVERREGGGLRGTVLIGLKGDVQYRWIVS